MTFQSPTQPLCRCCGKPIPKATRSQYFSDRPNTPHAICLDKLPANKAEAQRYINQAVIGVSRHRDGVYAAAIWDGESYKDDLFCKDRCAVTFGRLAARSQPDLQTVAYVRALKATAA